MNLFDYRKFHSCEKSSKSIISSSLPQSAKTCLLLMLQQKKVVNDPCVWPFSRKPIRIYIQTWEDVSRIRTNEEGSAYSKVMAGEEERQNRGVRV